jgi:isopentenyl phosphate kinase
MKQKELVFLKLGGSLITDKGTPFTARTKALHRISKEIAQALREDSSLQVLIGHGSGSFGHVSADQHHTHTGGMGDDYWQGFSKVWLAARELNQIVIESLSSSGLQVMAFPPSAGVISNNQQVDFWDIHPIQMALARNLIPIVQGDVVFDRQMGGTILSTEQVFHFLTSQLSPSRILLAGIEEGVYLHSDHPEDIIPHITPSNIEKVLPLLSDLKTIDVTGGMYSKVQVMLSLVKQCPALQVQIFSGEKPGEICKALKGESTGTRISA